MDRETITKIQTTLEITAASATVLAASRNSVHIRAGGLTRARVLVGLDEDGELPDEVEFVSGEAAVKVVLKPDQLGQFPEVKPSENPRLAISVPFINFKTIPVGSPVVSHNVVLTNRGKETLNATLAVEGFTAFLPSMPGGPLGPVSISPGGTRVVVIGFDPKEVGIVSGDLIISSNDPLFPEVEVPIRIDVFSP